MPTQSQGNEVVTTDAAADARMEPELKAKWVAALSEIADWIEQNL